ncbi:MAG: S8 family serine peptidase [Armatimonadota bacterium]
MSARGRRLVSVGFPALIALCVLTSGAPAARLEGGALSALPTPNDPACHQWVGPTPVQWPLTAAGALQAWGAYPGSYLTAADRPQEAPLVALVDTGVDPSHPDFRNAGASGSDVTSGGQLALSLARTFLSGDPRDGSSDVTDEHGHGTHLAGIIAAATNNGETAGSGIAGLAYPIRLLPIKVAGENGVALHADLARAITYAADQGASAIVIAFSGPTWSQTLQDAVDYAWERGCFLVAPTGDAMAELPSFPAACPHVFGVGAVGSEGRLTSYSTAGADVALVAPGGDGVIGVYSLLPTYACTLRQDGSSLPYGWLYGSAQAAAHVAAGAGLCAGLTGSRPNTGDEGAAIWRALEQAAQPVADFDPGTWTPEAGWGALALAPLTGAAWAPDETPQAGGLVGRVLLEGWPAIGATITATPLRGGEPVTASAVWPAGGYRLASLPAGDYRVTASSSGETGEWEQIVVLPGCDAPAVDFRLNDPPADSTITASQLPAAAVRGRTMQVSVTLRNTGESTWRRGDGYSLRQADPASPFYHALPRVGLAPGTAVAPGGSYTFTFALPVPDVCAFCHIAWQMCQDGGHGRFGDVAEATISVTSFLDVPADYWSVAEIEAAKASDLVQGYEDHTYHPADPVLRDQMAVYLARAVAGGDGAVPPGPATPHFADVGTGFWAYRHIEYVLAHGIASGYDDGLYHPEGTLDRGQMAAFIARAMAGGESGLASYTPPLTPSFPDVTADAWNYKHVEYIKGHGVAGGYGDGLYHPDWVCTRDQMAVYLVKAFEA